MKFNKLNINENFICRIWEGGKEYYSDLETTDKKKVEVISLGQRNYDAGPDYKNAKVIIGDKTYAGDIEIHRNLKNWEEHQHKGDAKYNSVILQVVMWDEPKYKLPKVRKAREVPTLILSKFLNQSIHIIWQDVINKPSKKFKLACLELNDSVDKKVVEQWLSKLSIERLKMKSSRIKDRLDELSLKTGLSIKNSKLWEQVLYEFIFEALGFSKNKEPMMKLAGIVNLGLIRKLKLRDSIDIQALLFGVSGLLFDVRYKDFYIIKIKERWSEYNDKLRIEKMNYAEWQFFRLRPQNFPTLRIAYGSQLIYKIVNENLFKQIIEFIQSNKTLKIFTKLFYSEGDKYWSSHYHFGKPSKSENKLIGTQRINDIIINVIIPITYLYSEYFKKNDLKESIIGLYNNIKVNLENSVTKMMSDQLLSKHHIKIRTASSEQAIIHLHNFYCVRNRCNECIIGKEVFKNKGYEYQIIFY